MKKMLKGFTLVEIMIVVAIIAILAAVAIPNFVTYRKTSQKNACISNLKSIQGAVEQAKMAGVASPAKADIIGATKYIKTEPICPATAASAGFDNCYTIPANDTDNPTCKIMGSDSTYPHTLPTVTAGS